MQNKSTLTVSFQVILRISEHARVCISRISKQSHIPMSLYSHISRMANIVMVDYENGFRLYYFIY